MLFPLMTLELARRIDQVFAFHTEISVKTLYEEEGNPFAIENKRFGHATAYTMGTWPDSWYHNRVLGLRTEDLDQVGDIVQFYHDRQVPCQIELLPGNLNEALARCLVDHGLYHTVLHSVLYGLPQTSSSTSQENIEIAEIDDTAADLFLDLYMVGHGLEPLDKENKERHQGRYFQPDIANFIAKLDGEPAALGSLVVNDGIAFLADAVTLPAYRGKGCHNALINRRIARAAELNCKLIVSTTEFASGSQRNLERAGLRLAYNTAVWQERKEAENGRSGN